MTGEFGELYILSTPFTSFSEAAIARLALHLLQLIAYKTIKCIQRIIKYTQTQTYTHTHTYNLVEELLATYDGKALNGFGATGVAPMFDSVNCRLFTNNIK